MDEVAETIVIVDDNPRVLHSMTRAVRRSGFVAAPFSSLVSALDELSRSPASPAAGIIDIYLERGRLGFELGDVLRERFGAWMPIVMVTGYTPASLEAPYWSAPTDTAVCSHFEDDRVPVYAKPVHGELLNAFLVRAATMSRLRRCPKVLRDRVVAYAIQRSLNPQETRLLASLAGGSTRATLANDLGLSKDTVKSQVRSVLEKCEVGGTDELIAALLRQITSAGTE